MSWYKLIQSKILKCIATSAAFLIMITGLPGMSHAAGLLKPKGGDQSLISIKSHAVSVTIDNGFARTEVDQVFVNSGDQDLEAIYSFPVPRQASLSELSLWIDGREIVGEVLEKARAKQVYEDQKAKGKKTAIAEKDDFKTFDVSVYPVKAQEDTRVRLVYYQPLEIDLNVGRYVYPLQEGGVDDERVAFWSVDGAVKESFTFDLVLKSTYPLKDVRMPGYSQQALIERISEEDSGGNGHVYHARLEFPEGADLAEDVVFYYRLDDSVPARVDIVPYKATGASEGTFMLTITPGVSLGRISEGIDWIFVLDKSGSMDGEKIRTLADGVSRVIGKMSPADRFRIVTFNNSAQDITQGFVNATPENVNRILEAVQHIQADGGTALYAGMSLGMKGVDGERTSVMVLVTDGVANIGPDRHEDFLKFVDEHDVRLFTFIIGNSANRPLLDRLAKASGGFSMDVSPRDDIFGRILQAKNKVLYEALHDVDIRFSGGGVEQLTPVAPGSLYRGQQLVMFGKYRKSGPVMVTMRAKVSGEAQKWSCEAVLPDADEENPEIERLWALSAIEDVMDEIRLRGETERLRSRIVELGTTYSLVTDHTSMIVLDEQEMEGLGIQRNNAARVDKERQAQGQRRQSTVKNYRVDTSPDGGMFKGAPSHSVGSGPVGPAFIGILLGCAWLVKRKRG